MSDEVDESMNTERWFRVWRRQAAPSMRVICLPHAGGQAQGFADWAPGLGDGVEVRALALPGRGSRFSDPPIPSMGALLDVLTPMIAALADAPLVFFGHSMGAIVAFELSRRLRQAHAALPAHLFVSGAPVPARLEANEPIHVLPDLELVDELRRLGGTEEEVLAHPELLPIVLPSVRADFRVLETWTSPDEPPLDVPITAFGGRADRSVPPDELGYWAEQTTGRFAVRLFDGDHFYLNHAREELLGAIVRELAQLRPRPPAPLADSAGN